MAGFVSSLIYWLVVHVVGCLVGHSVWGSVIWLFSVLPVSWLLGQQVYLLVVWLVGQLDGKSIGCSVYQLVGGPVNLFFSQ